MPSTSKKKVKKISAAEFDAMAERGEDLYEYFDFSKAVVVRRVNIDLSKWMQQSLDREALKLNISRQAVIKTWIKDRLIAEGYNLSTSKGKVKLTRRVPAKKHQPNHKAG